MDRTVPEFSKKETAEQAAFKRFVSRLGQEGNWVSVESRLPPEPDLLCIHSHRGPVAFELVSLTDPNIARVNAGYAVAGQTTFITSDPSERIVRDKLKRIYRSEHPIELLAYTDELIITPDDAILPVLKRWVGSVEHTFSTVWFMGETKTICLWGGE